MKLLAIEFCNELAMLTEKYRKNGLPLLSIFIAFKIMTDNIDKEILRDATERE